MSATQPLVTVFGSLHYDVIIEGPARPRKGETVTGKSWNPKCGGKGGNQAVAAARTGMRTAMIGVVADDDFGHTLLANLARRHVERRFVRVIEDGSTGMSVAIFDSEGDYGAVIVSGANLTLGLQDVADAAETIDQTRILVLQNEVPDAANVEAARAVRQAGGRVMLNAAPARMPSPELIALTDIIVVNAIEAEVLAGVPVVETLEGALDAARILSREYEHAVVTVGGAGVAYAGVDGAELQIDGIKVKLESTHGAGDEFIGVLAASLARGIEMEAALNAANKAAAKLVSTPESKRN